MTAKEIAKRIIENPDGKRGFMWAADLINQLPPRSSKGLMRKLMQESTNGDADPNFPTDYGYGYERGILAATNIIIDHQPK